MSIETISSAECPVSLLSRAPEIVQIARTFMRAEHAREGSGAALYGPDLSQWPARMVDALEIVEQEKLRARSAIEAKVDNAERDC